MTLDNRDPKNRVLFPWNFDQNFEKIEEQNLKSGVNYGPYLTHELLESKMRTFFGCLENLDYLGLRQICEPGLVKIYRKNIGRSLDYEVDIPNLEKATFEFDLYNVKTILAVGVEQNRRRNLFFDQYKVFKEQMEGGYVVDNILPKRMPIDAMARLFL